jgi:hypothetical protein
MISRPWLSRFAAASGGSDLSNVEETTVSPTGFAGNNGRIG